MAKAALGHEEGEWAEDGDQEGGRTPRGAQKAHQDPCDTDVKREGFSEGTSCSSKRVTLHSYPCNIVTYCQMRSGVS